MPGFYFLRYAISFLRFSKLNDFIFQGEMYFSLIYSENQYIYFFTYIVHSKVFFKIFHCVVLVIIFFFQQKL